MRTVTASRTGARRSTNGHRRYRSVVAAKDAAKGWAVSLLRKILLRKSVLAVIGLGTLASWYVRYRFFRPKVRRFRLF
ncbi:MAG TPA: hypothetical protein VF950_16035 [Planctomycetota bacterium]